MIIAVNTPQIETIPQTLMMEPLAWFFAEHYRHRKLCQLLLQSAESRTVDTAKIDEIVNFIEFDLPLHIDDEEQDLFPLLRRRCQPVDGMDVVLDKLSADHKRHNKTRGEIVSILKQARVTDQGLGACQSSVELIRQFCDDQRHHIALENAVVLPIARRRLSEADERALGKSLAARRGITDPFRKVS